MLEKGDMFPSACPVDGGTEDLDIGRCLEVDMLLFIAHHVFDVIDVLNLCAL